MKKNIILSLLGIIALTSCKNEEIPWQESTNDKVKVQFNVSSYDVEVSPMTRATAKESLTQIECIIYNYGTYETTTISQTLAGNPNDFGTLTAWLSPGEYQIGLIGAGTDGSGDNKGANAIAVQRSNYATFNGKSYDKDAFGYSTSFTVNKDVGMESNVTLERYVGKLCIQIENEIPEIIKRVEVNFSHRLWVKLSDRSTSEIDGRAEITKNLTITNNIIQNYERYITPNNSMEVKITSYDESDSEISSMTIPVQIYANKRTIIRGDASNLLNQTPFEISVNENWDSDIIVPMQ